MNNIRYAPTLATTPDTKRGHSNAIWYNCPIDDFQQDPQQGMYFRDDFLMSGSATMTSTFQGSIGQWAVYGAAGSQINDGALEGGVITIGSDGTNEGTTLQASSGSFRLVTTSTLALNGKLWFEARVARSTVATVQMDSFVGIMTPALSSGLPAANIPISTTDDTLSTTPSFIGFHSNATTGVRGGPTEWAFCFNLASGTVNYVTGLTTLIASSNNTTLTANAFVKLGFLFDPFANTKIINVPTARQTTGTIRKALIRVFVNGLELPTFLSSDDVQNATAGQAFPTGFMCPVIATMNAAAASNTFLCDSIEVAQIANS